MSTTTSSETSSETEPSFPLSFFDDFRGFAFLPRYHGGFRYVYIEVSGPNPNFNSILANEAIVSRLRQN